MKNLMFIIKIASIGLLLEIIGLAGIKAISESPESIYGYVLLLGTIIELYLLNHKKHVVKDSKV